MTPRSFANEMLVVGLVDHLDASYAYTVVAPEGGEATVFPDLQAAAIGVMTVLLLDGAIEPIVKDVDGWVTSSQPIGEVVVAFARGWLDEWPNDVPTPGALGWFRNTSKGDELARRSIASEES